MTNHILSIWNVTFQYVLFAVQNYTLQYRLHFCSGSSVWLYHIVFPSLQQTTAFDLTLSDTERVDVTRRHNEGHLDKVNYVARRLKKPEEIIEKLVFQAVGFRFCNSAITDNSRCFSSSLLTSISIRPDSKQVRVSPIPGTSLFISCAIAGSLSWHK